MKNSRTIFFFIFSVITFFMAPLSLEAAVENESVNYLDQELARAASASSYERVEQKPLLSRLWGGVVDGTKNITGNVVDGVKTVGNAVIDKAVDIGEGIVDVGKYAWHSVVEGVGEISDAITSTYEQCVDIVKPLLVEMGLQVADKFLRELAHWLIQNVPVIRKLNLLAEGGIFLGAIYEATETSLAFLTPSNETESQKQLTEEVSQYGNSQGLYVADHFLTTMNGYLYLLDEFEVVQLGVDVWLDGEIDSLRLYADAHAPERWEESYVNPCLGAMYAQLAGDCYEINSTTNTTTVSTASNGWAVVDTRQYEGSDFEAVLFKNTEENSGYYGEYVLAFRGTEFSADSHSKVNDLYADVFGNPAGIEEQYIEAAQYAMEVMSDPKYKGQTIKLTGHSLGGGLAQYAGYQTGLETITYNAADPGHWITGDGTTGHSDNITNYRYYNDAISALNIATYKAGLTQRLGTDYYLQGDASEFMEAHDWKTLRNLLGDKCSEEKEAGGSSSGENGDGSGGTTPGNETGSPGIIDISPPSSGGQNPPGGSTGGGNWEPPVPGEGYKKGTYQKMFYNK